MICYLTSRISRLMTIAIFAGTRPEVIKLAPLYRELKHREIATEFIAISQQVDLVKSHLQQEEITADVLIPVARDQGNLVELIGEEMRVLRDFPFDKYSHVIVQGDTTTALAVAQAAFMFSASAPRICHVEAGLRTSSAKAPFPEEVNRRLIAQLADLHCAPTPKAAMNLHAEHVQGKIEVTGNTGIDAYHQALTQDNRCSESVLANLNQREHFVLVTCHRRENWEVGIDELVNALNALPPNFAVLWPLHPNPAFIEKIVCLQNLQVYVIPPIEHIVTVQFIARASVIVTDSGGIIEEAAEAQRPCLVLRNETERVEALDDGCRLVPSNKRQQLASLIQEAPSWTRTSKGLYGDGRASQHIADLLAREL